MSPKIYVTDSVLPCPRGAAARRLMGMKLTFDMKIAMLFGNAIHSYLKKKARGHAEFPVRADINGVTVSGRIDVLGRNVTELKVISPSHMQWIVKNGPEEHHLLQALFYREILHTDKPVSLVYLTMPEKGLPKEREIIDTPYGTATMHARGPVTIFTMESPKSVKNLLVERARELINALNDLNSARIVPSWQCASCPLQDKCPALREVGPFVII